MISTLFFDFDGVLTTDFNGTGTVCRNLCKAIPGLSAGSVETCYRKHCGQLALGGNFGDVWDACSTCIGKKIALDLLEHALKTVPVNEAMFTLVRSLKRKCKIGIITDNEQERVDLLKKELQLPDLFDPIIVSASVHALKHDGTTTIFDAALKAANCKPGEALFIDNQERNLVTPAKIGMHTYRHDDKRNDTSTLVFALQKYGITP